MVATQAGRGQIGGSHESREWPRPLPEHIDFGVQGLIQMDDRPSARCSTNYPAEAAQAEGLLQLVLSALCAGRDQFELYAADCETLEQDGEVLVQKWRRKQTAIA